MKKYYSFLLVILFLGSCTITKRHFNKGWHIEWNKQHATTTNDNPIESNVITKYRSAETNEVTVDSIPEQAILSEPAIDLTTVPTSVSEVTTSEDQESVIDDFKSIEEGENISKEKQLTPQDEEIPQEEKSKSGIPRWLAILLAAVAIWLIILMGLSIGVLVYVLIDEWTTGYLLGFLSASLFMFIGIYLTLRLLNRKKKNNMSEVEIKEAKEAKKRKQNRLYCAICIVILILLIGVLVFMRIV